MIAALIGQTNIGHTILKRTGLSAEQAGYTSLSFSNPLSLPHSPVSKRQGLLVSFVINNQADTSQDYLWSLRLLQQGASPEVDSGQLELAPGRLETINRSVNLRCVAGRVKIVVELVKPEESIDAWVDCKVGKS
jgi:hypothetical protein